MEERSWNEAPSSITIKSRLRGFDTLLTSRGETGAETPPKLQSALDWLEQNGATPTGYNGNGRKANGNSANAATCPTHGTPMKQSRHGSGWYCPQKVADDDGTGRPVYCKQRIK